MNLEKLTIQVAEVARSAGEFIRQESFRFDQGKVELKGKSDLVSYVDRESEKKLVSELARIIPEAGFITEEGTAKQVQQELTWIIDPLDGTTNFVHGLPCFAVSIGLKRGDELISGVVYEINRDECFYAWDKGGAYMNGRLIRVSQVSSIDQSLFSTGFPIHNFGSLDNYLAILNALMKNSHGLRRVGSAACDLAYVACGRYEGFFEYNLNPWDVAGGAVVVKEAGGLVTDFSGENGFLFGRELVAAGPVHPELLEVIREHW